MSPKPSYFPLDELSGKCLLYFDKKGLDSSFIATKDLNLVMFTLSGKAVKQNSGYPHVNWHGAITLMQVD